jgi:hypothetical protein
MNRTDPPRFATWILEHLMTAESNQALDGDLMESFRAGRSASWYWRQVFSAIARRFIRSLFRHRFVLIFAAAWAMLSPAWFLILIRLQNESNFGGFIWRMPWPWSTVGNLGLSTVMALLFIWAGVLAYGIFLARVFGPVRLRRIGRIFAMGTAGYIVAFACESALMYIAYLSGLLSVHLFRGSMAWRTLTLPEVIVSFALWTTYIRLPYLIGTACALWGAVPEAESSVRLAE